MNNFEEVKLIKTEMSSLSFIMFHLLGLWISLLWVLTTQQENCDFSSSLWDPRTLPCRQWLVATAMPYRCERWSGRYSSVNLLLSLFTAITPSLWGDETNIWRGRVWGRLMNVWRQEGLVPPPVCVVEVVSVVDHAERVVQVAVDHSPAGAVWRYAL